MSLEQYWNKAVSFEEFLADTERRLNEPKNQEEADKKKYYELGVQRMQRALKTFKREDADLQVLKSKNFNGRILIITEGWCGDSSQSTPSIVEFFKGENEVRIFYRDSDTTLIDQFLTDGTQSIPKVLLLDENFQVIGVWGPRTKYGIELLKKFKADPENYPREQFYNDLQVYYAKNKGKDTITEILELL